MLLAALLVAALAAPAPRTQAALDTLRTAASSLAQDHLQTETLAALQPAPCVRHRTGLTPADEAAIIQTLRAKGLLQADQSRDVVFPPLGEGSTCSSLPQSILTAPGGNTGSHHDWSGGLVAHEAFNLRFALSLADLYEAESGVPIDRQILTASVLWHDWAKALVLTWRDDGTLVSEGAIGGAGAHHVLGLAEAMARGLPPAMILAQACAHAAPVEGDRGKVEGWLRAAAIVSRTAWTTTVQPSRECLISNAADDNWIHAEAAVHAADAALAGMARDRRNAVLEQLGADRIKALLDTEGDAGLERALRAAGF